MKNIPSANQLTGRAIGATFFAFFGALWVLLALYDKQHLKAATVSWVLMDMLVLLSTAFWVFRQARRFPKMPEDSARGRVFTIINAVQWIAISIVAFSFARLHIDAYLLSAITAIVGLHFFPLARLFRYGLHYVTGSVLVAWAAAGIALFPVKQLQGDTALGTGIILWVSAFVTLLIAATAARRALAGPGAQSASTAS